MKAEHVETLEPDDATVAALQSEVSRQRFASERGASVITLASKWKAEQLMQDAALYVRAYEVAKIKEAGR